MPDETGEQTQSTNEPKGIKLEPDPNNPDIKIGKGKLEVEIFAAKDGTLFLDKQAAIEYNNSLG